MPPDLFTYDPLVADPAGSVQRVRFTYRRSRLSALHRQLRDELGGRLWAGRKGNFGDCIAHEAKAAATTAKIEAVMADQGYSMPDIATFLTNARHAVSVAFKQWEEAYAINEAGKLSAREAHPEWFGKERPVEPYALLREALACLRWAKETGQDRFASQQRLKAQSWSTELQRELEREGHRPEEIAKVMWHAWERIAWIVAQ